MITKGKYDAQSMEEMVADMQVAKEQGLSTRRGQSLYKQQSGEYQEDKLKDLVAMNLAELAELATKEKVSLENVDEVKRRTIYYLKACAETGTFPSSMGLSRSLGYSDRALRHWRSKKADTPTAEWLEMFCDTCSDILSQSALKNNANSIMSIFLSKALYGLREATEVVVTPGTQMEDMPDYNAEEIRRRYLVDADDNSEYGDE